MGRSQMIKFPGNIALNLFSIGIGVIFILIGVIITFQPTFSTVAVDLLVGFGSGLFLAGFLGYMNIAILSQEVDSLIKQPFEDISILGLVKGAGLEWVTRERNELTHSKLVPSLEREQNQIIIVGSSLKGLIGVGKETLGNNQKKIREIIEIKAKQGKADINILMTSPEIAHHRQKQEGRKEGDIEREIIENIIQLVKLRNNCCNDKSKFKIGLYNGTPTIFMLCTSEYMMLNPYPYYSKAYNSFAFLIKSGSIMYNGYYDAHYRSAMEDDNMTMSISDDPATAKEQIRSLITGENPHGNSIIPDKKVQDILLSRLDEF